MVVVGPATRVPASGRRYTVAGAPGARRASIVALVGALVVGKARAAVSVRYLEAGDFPGKRARALVRVRPCADRRRRAFENETRRRERDKVSLPCLATSEVQACQVFVLKGLKRIAEARLCASSL